MALSLFLCVPSLLMELYLYCFLDCAMVATSLSGPSPSFRDAQRNHFA
jgi:hypothetical protein